MGNVDEVAVFEVAALVGQFGDLGGEVEVEIGAEGDEVVGGATDYGGAAHARQFVDVVEDGEVDLGDI